MDNANHLIAQIDWSDPSDEGDQLIRRGTGVQSDRGEKYIASQETQPPRIENMFSDFDNVASFLLPVGIFLALLMVVIGGYMWMTSSGSPDKVKQAQGTLTWAIIGLVFIIIASLLVKTVIDYIVGM